MDFRPASAGDLAAEFEVFERAQRELYERRGAKWAGRDFSEWERLHLHVLHHDSGRSFVAEETGRAVGFTAAWVRRDVWFLSALFGLPERQGGGSESDFWNWRGARHTGAGSRSPKPSNWCLQRPTRDAV